MDVIEPGIVIYLFPFPELLLVPCSLIVPSREEVGQALIVGQLVRPSLLNSAHDLCEVDGVCNIREVKTWSTCKLG